MNNSYKVGDKIIESGQVYRIFKIKKQKNSEGKLEKIVYFNPHYKTAQNTSVICSIPALNIEKTGIRKPISKNRLERLMQNLTSKKTVEKFSDINKAKMLLKSNDPADTVKLLITLWREKNKETENFSKSKRIIFDLAMENLVQELALVEGVSLEKAREEINLALQD